MIYLCWWNKPLDVYEPIQLELKNEGGELHPIRDKSEAALLAEESVKLDRTSKLPWLRNYTVTRRLACLRAVLNKAMYDVLVSLAGGAAVETRKTDGIEKAQERSPVGMVTMEVTLIIIIAGLHAVASKNTFPTETEAYLWRMACIGMCVCSLLAYGTMLVLRRTSYQLAIAKATWINHQAGKITCWQWVCQTMSYLHELPETQGEDKNKVRKWYHISVLMACSVFMGGYLVCVLYITIESYISLRNSPDGMFLTPQWGDYWPHL